MKGTPDPLRTGMPIAVEAERAVLGAIMLGHVQLPDAMVMLGPEDFALQQHKMIFAAILEVAKTGDQLDRLMVTRRLMDAGKLDDVGGLSYMVDLDDGLPQLPNFDGYIRIVRDKSVLRKTILGAQQLINECLLTTEGAESAVQAAQRFAAGLAVDQKQKSNWESIGTVLQAQGLDELMCPTKSGEGIDLPWRAVNTALCGLQEGMLFVLAGRPSMGKSAAAFQIATHIAAKGHPVALFILEDHKHSLARRMLSAIARVDAQKMREGFLNVVERDRISEAAEKLVALPIWIDDSRADTLLAIDAALLKLQQKDGVTPRVAIFDHLQLMRGTDRRHNRTEEIGEICHGVKRIAVRLGGTAILLSQLNRECENEKRRPQLSDLRSSGDIEQDADVVAFVHRPERYWPQREDLRGETEFIIAKQRNGPTGIKKLVWLGEFQRFENRADEEGL